MKVKISTTLGLIITGIISAISCTLIYAILLSNALDNLFLSGPPLSSTAKLSIIGLISMPVIITLIIIYINKSTYKTRSQIFLLLLKHMSAIIIGPIILYFVIFLFSKISNNIYSSKYTINFQREFCTNPDGLNSVKYKDYEMQVNCKNGLFNGDLKSIINDGSLTLRHYAKGIQQGDNEYYNSYGNTTIIEFGCKNLIQNNCGCKVYYIAPKLLTNQTSLLKDGIFEDKGYGATTKGEFRNGLLDGKIEIYSSDTNELKFSGLFNAGKLTQLYYPQKPSSFENLLNSVCTFFQGL